MVCINANDIKMCSVIKGENYNMNDWNIWILRGINYPESALIN